MKKWRDEDLFPKTSGQIPNWMAIRDAEAKRRRENEAKLRAARLTRDANEAAERNGEQPRPKPRSKTRQS